jgi:hypothetical protein
VENTENTQAFAIVGPGSEWFWIALQFFALAGTFYAIYRQLRAQQIEIQESTKAQLSLGYHMRSGSGSDRSRC